MTTNNKEKENFIIEPLGYDDISQDVKRAIEHLRRNGFSRSMHLITNMLLYKDNSMDTAYITYNRRKCKFEIHLNFDFISKYKDKDIDLHYGFIQFVLLHEIGHFVQKVFLREKNLPFSHGLINISADCPINESLLDSKIKLPLEDIRKELVTNTWIEKYIEKQDTLDIEKAKERWEDIKNSKYYFEAIAQFLWDITDDDKKQTIYRLGSSEDEGQILDDHDKSREGFGNGISDELNQAIKDEINKAKAYGSGSSDEERFWNSITQKPQLSLNMLRRAIKSLPGYIAKKDTWKRRNKRVKSFYWKGSKYNGGKITVTVDTSGSMGQKEFDVILNELYHMSRKFEIRLIQWGTEVLDDIIIKPNTNIKSIKLLGGGGTDIQSVFTYLNEKDIKSDIYVHFTDGYFDYNFDYHGITNNLWCIMGDNTDCNLKGKVQRLVV